MVPKLSAGSLYHKQGSNEHPHALFLMDLCANLAGTQGRESKRDLFLQSTSELLFILLVSFSLSTSGPRVYSSHSHQYLLLAFVDVIGVIEEFTIVLFHMYLIN